MRGCRSVGSAQSQRSLGGGGSIGSKAIGADLIAERLRDGSTADHDPNLAVQFGGVNGLHNAAHLFHACR